MTTQYCNDFCHYSLKLVFEFITHSTVNEKIFPDKN